MFPSNLIILTPKQVTGIEKVQKRIGSDNFFVAAKEVILAGIRALQDGKKPSRKPSARKSSARRVTEKPIPEKPAEQEIVPPPPKVQETGVATIAVEPAPQKPGPVIFIERNPRCKENRHRSLLDDIEAAKVEAAKEKESQEVMRRQVLYQARKTRKPDGSLLSVGKFVICSKCRRECAVDDDTWSDLYSKKTKYVCPECAGEVEQSA